MLYILVIKGSPDTGENLNLILITKNKAKQKCVKAPWEPHTSKTYSFMLTKVSDRERLG